MPEKSTKPAETAGPNTGSQQTPEASEPTALRYAGDGDEFFSGVPRRDLTAREVAELEPAVLRNITAPNPTTGKALYVPAAPAKE
jgi:hypothetical protein